MIFNPWRKYPKRKPKEDGWYLCTVYDEDNEKSYVMRLYYRSMDKKWRNNDRISVFQGYNVYKVCRAPIEENRVYRDGLCERDDVVAWKKLPREYRGKNKKGV